MYGFACVRGLCQGDIGMAKKNETLGLPDQRLAEVSFWICSRSWESSHTRALTTIVAGLPGRAHCPQAYQGS